MTRAPHGIKKAKERPAGHRVLTAYLNQQTEKAAFFEYYSWQLWLPKSAIIRLPGNVFTAPLWAIDGAKEWRLKNIP